MLKTVVLLSILNMLYIIGINIILKYIKIRINNCINMQLIFFKLYFDQMYSALVSRITFKKKS